MIFVEDQERELRMQDAFRAYVGGMLDILTKAASKKAKKLYCYCNLCGTNALFGGFYIDKKDIAVLTPVFLTTNGMKPTDADELQATIVKLLERLRGAYMDICSDIPGELFLEYDLSERSLKCLVGKAKYPQLYDANLHYCAWAKSYGAVVPDLPPRDRSLSAAIKRKLFGAKSEVDTINPLEGAQELELSWY